MWIKPADRLPEPNQIVLVHPNIGDLYIVAIYSHATNRWLSVKDCRPFPEYQNVVAWMVIPPVSFGPERR